MVTTHKLPMLTRADLRDSFFGLSLLPSLAGLG